VDKNWNRSQPWKEHLPQPGTVGAAARDFAKEAAELHRSGQAKFIPPGVLPPGFRELLDTQVAVYEGAMLDAYMTGVMEFAKALTTGDYLREPWVDDAGGTKQYRQWFDGLPDASGIQPGPGPEVDLSRGADPRLVSNHYMELYAKQPCEVYGRQLFDSLLRWPAAESWAHFGIVRAVYDESRQYRSGTWLFRAFFAAYMGALTACRSKYAGTWNDYHATRWLLASTAKDSQASNVRETAVVELHERIHLAKKTGDDKWIPVSTSAAWCVGSLRKQYPQFEADFRAVVPCEYCLKGLAPENTL
jgi:hypothetical protein